MAPSAGTLAVVRALVDLLCPARCAGCDAVGRAVCAACSRALGSAAALRRPDPCPPGLPPVAAVADHDGPVRRLLIAHKDRGRLDVGPALGAALARSVRVVAPGRSVVVLVPVPSSRDSVRRRGFDHTLRLARAAARELGPRASATRVLVRARSTADQSGLGAAARAANVSGALVAGGFAHRLSSSSAVVIVDDILTTGSTLAEAARALRATGIEPTGAAVVAARVRRLPRHGREG